MSGECHESRVQVNSGEKVNTTAFTSIHNSYDNGVMYERQRSSAFIQLTPRRESSISDGLNTHQVDVHRAYASDEEVSNSDKRGIRDVVEFAPTRILHLAHGRGANAERNADRGNVVDIEPTKLDVRCVKYWWHQYFTHLTSLYHNGVDDDK